MAKKKNSKTSPKKIIGIIAGILAVLVVVGFAVYAIMGINGFFGRHTYSVKSEHRKVSNNMMSYYLLTNYNQYYSSFSYYIQQGMTADQTNSAASASSAPSLSQLKDIQCSLGSEDPDVKTWYDYFLLEITVPQVKQMLVLAEAADAAGYKLTDEDKAQIDETIEQWKTTAQGYGYGEGKEFTIFGTGVKEKDVRAALELSQLASSYSKSVSDSFSYTDEQYNSYLEEHKDDFRYVDVLSYTVNGEKLIPEKTDDEAVDTADLVTDTDDAVTDDAVTDDADTEDAVTDDAVTDDADTEDAVTDDADTEDADTEDADTEDVDTEDADTEDAVTEDVDTEDADTEDAESADAESADAESADSAEDDAAKQEYYKKAENAANEMAAAKSEEQFRAAVEKYLREELYADLEEDELDSKVNSDLEAITVQSKKFSATDEITGKLFEAAENTAVLDDSSAENGSYTVYFVISADHLEEYSTKNVYAITVEAQEEENTAAAAETVKITDRAIEDGDKVNIDYVGSVDGVEFEGGNTNGAGTEVTAGGTDYIDDFLTQIIGHMPGETFDVNVTFPDEYPNNPDLAGKDAVFVTTINYIVGKNDASLATVKAIEDALAADNSAENFEKLAKEYSVGTQTYIENVAKNYFGDEAIDEWLFDPERKAGDRKTFEVTASENGEEHVHHFIIQYAGEGRAKWINDVDSALRSADLNAKSDEFTAAYGGDKITVDKVKLYKIG